MGCPGSVSRIRFGFRCRVWLDTTVSMKPLWVIACIVAACLLGCRTVSCGSCSRVGEIRINSSRPFTGLGAKFIVNGREVSPGDTVILTKSEATNVVSELWLYNCYDEAILVFCSPVGCRRTLYRDRQLIYTTSGGAPVCGGNLPFEFLCGRAGAGVSSDMSPSFPTGAWTQARDWDSHFSATNCTHAVVGYEAKIQYVRPGDRCLYTNTVSIPVQFRFE